MRRTCKFIQVSGAVAGIGRQILGTNKRHPKPFQTGCKKFVLLDGPFLVFVGMHTFRAFSPFAQHLHHQTNNNNNNNNSNTTSFIGIGSSIRLRGSGGHKIIYNNKPIIHWLCEQP